MNDLDKNIIEAINKLQDSYDAFLIYNKYTSLEDLNDNTHKKEFELLLEKFKNDEMCMKAIKWIMNCYDYYYKDEFNDGNDAFSYLRNKIKEKK